MPAQTLATYVINLPRSTERRARIEQQLAALALGYRIFPGVDGTTEWARLAPTLNEPAFRRNVGRPVLPGEIGCYHAHLGVWRDFLDGVADVALVMEDDVVFHPEFNEALQTALSVSDQWDLLKLNRIRAKQPIRQMQVGQWQINAYLGPATGTGAYLVTRGLVQRLLPRMEPITRPFDHELDRIHVHHFRHFGLEPFPSHVDDGQQSTITGARFASVRKFPWYRRMSVHFLRLGNLLGKSAYLCWTGRLIPRRRTVQPKGTRPPFATQ